MRKRTQLQIWIGLVLLILLFSFLFFMDTGDIPEVQLAYSPTDQVEHLPLPIFPLALDRENVQGVIATIEKPQYVWREIRQTRFWGDLYGSRSGQIWQSPTAMRLSWDNGEHMLFTPTHYYFWFLQNPAIQRPNVLQAGESFTQMFDEFTGLFSVEQMLARDASDILSVRQGDLTLGDTTHFVIILSMEQGLFGLRDYYTICAHTGLLLQMESYDGETLVYRFETLALQLGEIESSVFTTGG